ncbi:MAG: aspartate:alanine exchanger family transporter [Gulosibacter sp.]|uniref:aspartate:alanine exchanger family transporter n=1 Tax=Gulosibacter sp. TaxID=2817531 RepID=UPI003F8EAC38
MVELLLASPLLTLFLTAALGTLLGAIPFGPLKFGAAGALFVGLAIGALDPDLGTGLEIVQSIGLALFVYTVGLASGATFFQDLRRQAPLILGAVALLVVFAAIAIAANHILDIGSELTAGMMAGALTSTPALAAATTAAGGSVEPAVGYSIAYPVGVIITMIIVTIVARRPLPGKRDPNRTNLEGLEACTVAVEHPMRVNEIPGIAEIPGSDTGEVRVSYLQRDGGVSVATPTELLHRGDRVVVVGVPDAVKRAQEALGSRVQDNLVHDRSVVDYRRFIVSDPDLVGRTVAELLIPLRFDGLITRVRRGDHDLLPTAEMTLQLGDRVLVVAPRKRLGEVSEFFGDSEKRITEIDFFSMGLGIALGVAVGLISLPFGGGLSIALGSAAGPLIVGLILGRMERTGPIVWSIPMGANLTIRQLGLVIFLAAVGLASGQAFADTAFTLTGLTIALTAAVMLAGILLLLWWWSRVTGMSSARAAGAIAGFVGQPAILSHVNSLVDDARASSGYAALFAIGIIVKIVLVQAVAVL